MTRQYCSHKKEKVRNDRFFHRICFSTECCVDLDFWCLR